MSDATMKMRRLQIQKNGGARKLRKIRRPMTCRYQSLTQIWCVLSDCYCLIRNVIISRLVSATYSTGVTGTNFPLTVLPGRLSQIRRIELC